MRIAQVAPLTESVPPRKYGGTERIVAYLTDKLVAMGHEVTLFASGDSVTKAHLIAPTPIALRHNPAIVDAMAHIMYMLELVQQLKDDFDVIHYHVDYFHFPFSRRNTTSHCTTMHGRLDIEDLIPLFREFSDMPLVSISYAQRKPMPFANFIRTIYHGIPAGLLKLHPGKGEYVAFIGRISPEKRVDRAIEIAVKAGIPLKVAAKVDKVDQQYYEELIKPLFKKFSIEYIGEINEQEKYDFLGNAIATLFPIDWPEPFGLVMIESMACGTPVIAFNCGSVPEVIDEGVTGYIVQNVDEGIARLSQIANLDRTLVRQRFDERFTDQRMADDYVSLYHELINNRVFGNKTMIV